MGPNLETPYPPGPPRTHITTGMNNYLSPPPCTLLRKTFIFPWTELSLNLLAWTLPKGRKKRLVVLLTVLKRKALLIA